MLKVKGILDKRGFTQHHKDGAGFTLIELLIVIVILGILAVAILSAINPLEQIRKANDSGKKSDSAEMLNALERYFTTFQCYPWSTNTTTCDNETTLSTPTLANSAAVNVADLVAKNEIKSEFQQRDNLGFLYVSEETGGLVHVCFAPESATFQDQADKAQDGGDWASGTKYICVPE